MGTRKKGPVSEIRDDLKKIKETERRILSALNGEAIAKAARYDELMSYLQALEFSVSRISSKYDDDGNIRIKVTFDVPSYEIAIDPNGDENWSPSLVAMNALNLMSYQDMMRIAEFVEKHNEYKTK